MRLFSLAAEILPLAALFIGNSLYNIFHWRGGQSGWRPVSC